MTAVEARIGKIVERWYVSEPALFQTYITHDLEPAAGIAVAMRCGRGKIQYNPALASALGDTALEDHLRAELLRILLKHPYDRQPPGCPRAVLAIASNLVLADNYSFAGIALPRPADYGLPSGESFEWYALHLQQKGDSNTGDEEGSAGDASAYRALADLSGLWDEDPFMCCTVDLAIEAISAMTFGWGNIPGNLVDKIVADTNARIDYRKVLSAFRASVLSERRRLTRMRPNRRAGFSALGSRNVFSTRLLVAVDVSSSISDMALKHFFSIINRMFKYGIECVDVMQFDAGLKPLLTMRQAMREVKITGRGGTDFQPVIDYVAAHPEYDGVAIFTDGQALEPSVPRLGTKLAWICDSESNYNLYHSWMERSGLCCHMTV